MANSNEKTIKERVSEVIEKLRPYLQADGGDVTLVDVTDDNIVKVSLTGACGSCPFRQQTLKSGIEEAVKNEIPEIKEVVAD